MSKRIILVLFILAAFCLGIGITTWYFKKSQPNEKEEAVILMEKIKTVSKLITVEGYLSEIYDYKEYYGYDWSPFRKKALLRVKAKVSAGLDLTDLDIQLEPDIKTVYVRGIPEPEILSVDHDIDYYDVQEGTFNNFTASDYTKLNSRAKKFIRAKAEESELMSAARDQGQKMIEMLRFLVESEGWKLMVFPNEEEVGLEGAMRG
jgi:hypothetical protein